jgi:hypothetical protein
MTKSSSVAYGDLLRAERSAFGAQRALPSS